MLFTVHEIIQKSLILKQWIIHPKEIMKKSLCHTPAACAVSDIRTDKKITDTPAAVAVSFSICFSRTKVEETARITKVSPEVDMKYKCHPSSEILY